MLDFEPEIVIHMAAQPLFLSSYSDPVGTCQINVMGTVNLFEAFRGCKSVKVVVNVTTDKCYENNEWVWGYRESEPMGGYDPYSNSKGCSKIVISAYRQSSFQDKADVSLASVKTGNVIGGGDWADNRLIPDVLSV
jgi:CDP-glucose 4,6-dehydratase